MRALLQTTVKKTLGMRTFAVEVEGGELIGSSCETMKSREDDYLCRILKWTLVLGVIMNKTWRCKKGV